jgi:hypothetical protein
MSTLPSGGGPVSALRGSGSFGDVAAAPAHAPAPAANGGGGFAAPAPAPRSRIASSGPASASTSGDGTTAGAAHAAGGGRHVSGPGSSVDGGGGGARGGSGGGARQSGAAAADIAAIMADVPSYSKGATAGKVSMAGIAVNEDCVNLFLHMKARSAVRFVVFGRGSCCWRQRRGQYCKEEGAGRGQMGWS